METNRQAEERWSATRDGVASNEPEVLAEWREIEGALDRAGSRAISATGRSVGQSKVFAFARILRGWKWSRKDGKPMEPTADQVADYIDLIYVRHWTPIYPKLQLGSDGLSFWDAGYISGGDPRGEFLLAWNDIRIADGKTLFETAEKNAADLPLKPCRAHSRRYCEFISFAGHLQQLRRPGQTIQLPVELLAERFQVSPRMISQYRKWAMHDGILREVTPANCFQKLATEYYFQVDRFNWKSGRQIPIESTIEPAVELAFESGSSSIGSSNIGFSGFSEVPKSSLKEPDGCALKDEERNAIATPSFDNDLKRLSESKAMQPMTDEQYNKRYALLKAQVIELKARGIQ